MFTKTLYGKKALAFTGGLVCLVLSGCGLSSAGNEVPESTAPSAAVPSSTPMPSESAPSAAGTPTTLAPAPSATPGSSDDLLAGPVARTLKASGLTVNVTYSGAPAVTEWTPAGSKSVDLSLSVINRQRPAQKIYLSKATLRFGDDERAGWLSVTEPVVDSADISPGYLAASPYSYKQSYAIPPIEPGPTQVRLDFKYELVTLVDKKARDYTKQVVSDTLVITVPG